MLPRKRRLTRGEHATMRGRMVRGAYVSLRPAPKKSGEVSKFSVVVSKKVAPSAVARNRIRRRIYAILEKEATLPCSAVIFPTKEALTVSLETLQKELLLLFAKS